MNLAFFISRPSSLAAPSGLYQVVDLIAHTPFTVYVPGKRAQI
jgi:hypothetical protein